MKRILQIIPADGWFSVYGERDENGEIAKVEVIRRLISFALVDENNIQSVEGVDSGDNGIDDLCTESSDFLRYVHEHDAAYRYMIYLYNESLKTKEKEAV